MIARPDPDIWFTFTGESVQEHYAAGVLDFSVTVPYDEVWCGGTLPRLGKSEWWRMATPDPGPHIVAQNNDDGSGYYLRTDQTGEFIIHGHLVPVRVKWDRVVYSNGETVEVSRTAESTLLTPIAPAWAYTMAFPAAGHSEKIENLAVFLPNVAGY